MSRKLLLADDSITIQKVIGITFANEDYQLTIVDNGDAALEKARADRPDLILADVFMPGKNGYEVAAAVKQDPALRGVPVLLLAGTFEPFDEEKAVSSGADSWISKPFESQALITKVEELLALRPAAAPIQPVAPVAQAPVSDPWGDVDHSTAESPVASELPIFEDDADFIVDDNAGDELTEEIQDVWADTESIPLEEIDVVALEPIAPPVQSAVPPVQPAVPPVQPAAPPVQPAAPPVRPATAAGIESQVAALSENDLERLIERVAGVVLEKIAWEVVPDLAETLIKAEIRKIRESA
ncbi:MAG: response regulator [Desulfuromonadales bacterium]|nr:response regulator [Desulfuromonadales bacterium]